MEKAIETHLEKLAAAVRATTIPADSKHASTCVLGRLQALYILLRATEARRYNDDITRLFQQLIKELALSGAACPDAAKLAAGIPEGVRVLHERLGLPRMALRAPASPIPLPRPRKPRKVAEKK